jgi:hypothetical protein
LFAEPYWSPRNQQLKISAQSGVGALTKHRSNEIKWHHKDYVHQKDAGGPYGWNVGVKNNGEGIDEK